MLYKKKSSLKKKAIIVVFILFFLIALLNVFQANVRNFFYVISAPFQKAFWAAGNKTSDFLMVFVNTNETRKEIEKIEKENNKLITEIANLKELKEENETLRRGLKLELQKEFNLSFAEITGKDISGGFILINKGSKDGISKDMPVITSEKILIGKIDSVYKNFSKVMLLTNKKISFDVIIQGDEDISGVGVGDGHSKILVNFVPAEKKIEKGNVVITNSLGGIFPKGLFVGKVKEIIKNDLDASQIIKVSPAMSADQLNYLFVIKKSI